MDASHNSFRIAIAIVPFRKKFARFYASINQYHKAIKQYQEVYSIQHSFYKAANKNEGETLFEISQLLLHIGDLDHAKKYFLDSAICFNLTQRSWPFRLLEFSAQVLSKEDKCFCGSNIAFETCHFNASRLNLFSTNIEIPIKITGLKVKYKISIFVLRVHQSHHLISQEEYMNGYQLVYSRPHKDSFNIKIKTDRELPIIIELFSYEYLPIRYETVLRSEGIRINLES